MMMMMHYVFWCVLCVWAKLAEIKLDDDVVTVSRFNVGY